MNEAIDSVERLVRFVRTLRAHGIGVGMGDATDGMRAWVRVDGADPDEVRRALRIALRIPRESWDLYHALFESFWADETEPRRVEPRRPVARKPQPVDPAGVVRRVVPVPVMEEAHSPQGDRPGYSPEALLRRKPFGEWTESDLRAMEILVSRLARRLATRRHRRLVPVRSGGRVDLRRSFRKAIATRGEVLELARRDRPVEKPDLVVLCDTSGSMDPHARFLLAFVLALRRVVGRCEIYVFNTALTRLTPWIGHGDLRHVLDRLVAEVPDWSGGTRIGRCLADLLSGGHVIGPATVVVILSDGLDQGDATELERAMRTIHRRARRVIWLNPLLSDPRYEPNARGMKAALPFVDRFAPAHDLVSLELLVPELRG